MRGFATADYSQSTEVVFEVVVFGVELRWKTNLGCTRQDDVSNKAFCLLLGITQSCLV